MKLSGLRQKIEKCKFVVLGDVILDHYLEGLTTRLSKEAPVPIVRVNGGFHRLGGAANVAANIAAMKAKVSLLGVVGHDLDSAKLASFLNASGMGYSLVEDATRKTTKKTRVISQSQQLLRIDHEDTHYISKNVCAKVKEDLKGLLKDADALVISDYAKGVLCQDLLLFIEDEVSPKVPIFYAPKPPVIFELRGPACVVVNQEEAEAFLGKSMKDMNVLVSEIQSLFCCGDAVITMGSKGMVFSNNGNHGTEQAVKKEVYDVSGAGDTVLAVFAVCRTVGISMDVCAKIASEAAAQVLMELGTAPVKWTQVKEIAW